uniref:Uncharacterized protein n=1 Tax=Anguilla anguilla TaxID=7936 RepID=A0A0E9X3L5_ANGAN
MGSIPRLDQPGNSNANYSSKLYRYIWPQTENININQVTLYITIYHHSTYKLPNIDTTVPFDINIRNVIDKVLYLYVCCQ